MKKKFPLLILVLALLLTACSPKTKALRQVNIALTYIPNIQFAPFYLAMERGYFEELGLDLSLSYGNEADLMALVGAGKEQFMIASGEQILLSRAQGLPVLSVLPWYKDYPVGVASLVEANINEVQDLKGKNIGLPGLYGANYIGFEALAAANGMSDADYTLRSIGYTQVEALVSKQVDAVVIYLANEPVQLRTQGYEIKLLKVSDAMPLIGNCLVTNEATTENDPELVRLVASGLHRAIRDTAADPEAAYQISLKYVENLDQADPEAQKGVLAESIKLWETGQPGDQTPAWEAMQELLLHLDLISNPVDISKVWTNEFIP